MGLWPSFKGSWPRYTPEGSSPVWGCEQIMWKSENGIVIQRRKFCEAITSNARDPVSKILIKDHKKTNEKWEFPTRLVIPATNFTANVPQDWLSWDKSCLHKVKVYYSRISIFQASDLKKIHKELKIKRDEVTISSIDAINMYPFIKRATIKKAVKSFARKITAATKKIINLCL